METVHWLWEDVSQLKELVLETIFYLSSGFLKNRVSSQPSQLHRLARKIEISPLVSLHMILSSK